MLRLHGIVGHRDDPDIQSRLHHVEHHGGIEFLFVPPHEAGRKRFRLATDKGTDCAVSLERDEVLTDGALLFLAHGRAVIARFGEQAVWRLRPRDASAALGLGWHAGNLHWRVRFEDDILVVLLDGPPADYRARIAHLLAGNVVEEVTDV